MFNSKKHSIHVKYDMKNLNMVNAISRLNKKTLSPISNNTYLKDTNKIIAYNNQIKKQKVDNLILNNNSSYLLGGSQKSEAPYGGVSNNNTHMSYLMNNINNINLNNNIGLKQGILMSYNKIVSYNYNPSKSIIYYNNKYKNGIVNKILINNTDIFNINKLLISFFKSIYCIIGKPVFIHTGDKVIIQLFYYLNIPKKKIFRLFSLLYLKNFKSKLLKYSSLTSNKSKRGGKYLGIPYIKGKNRKSISRLRRKSDKIRINLFNLRKWSIVIYYKNKFKLLCQLLSKQFNKSVELQLIRLHNPNHDSNILVNLLSLNIRNKTKKARRAIQNIYNKNSVKIINDFKLKSVKNIPNYISGLNIKIAGRLMREPIIPRLTTKVVIKGASSPGKVNYLDIATMTKKNRKGAYTITIKSGQNFFNVNSKSTNNLNKLSLFNLNLKG
jgi:hypothetical protein